MQRSHFGPCMYAGRWIFFFFFLMNSISATLMPLLPSRYNTKNGHISEAEINAGLKTDNWAALSWKPPTLALYKEIPIVTM